MTGENRVAMQRVVHDVADKKSGREDEGQQHARAMRFAVVMFDEIQPHAESKRTQSVENRVEGRQKHPAPSEIGGGMMNVEQPQEKGHGEAADDDDRSNHGARINLSLFHADD